MAILVDMKMSILQEHVLCICVYCGRVDCLSVVCKWYLVNTN